MFQKVVACIVLASAIAEAQAIDPVTEAGAAVVTDQAINHPFRTLLIGGGLAYMLHCHRDASGNFPKECLPKNKNSSDQTNLNNIQNPDDINLLRSSHTAELRKGLNDERIASGLPPDPEDCDAHHIVPKQEGRQWAKQYADDSREILNECEISIDSAENGVYLPGSKVGAKCSGTYHKSLHTREYYINIRDRLANAYTQGCDAVYDELRNIKAELLEGK